MDMIGVAKCTAFFLAFLIGITWFGLTVEVAFASDLPPEVLLLSKIKARAAQDLSRLESCTCLVTLERSTRDIPKRPFKHVDTVEAEVADINGHEMYAWPGTSEFRLTSLAQLIGTGLAGTGVFSSFAVNLFVVGTGTFQYAGNESLSGTPAARYDFRVSALSSGYRMNAATGGAVIGISGILWADPVSFHLLRLKIIGQDIPALLGIRSTETDIEYSLATLSDGVAVVMPTRATEIIEYDGGTANRNRLEFTHCHQTTGTMRTPSVDGSHRGTPPDELTLPVGLWCVTRLQTTIDSQKTRVGDPISATVFHDVLKKKTVVIPAGAVLTGRVRMLQKDGPDYVIGLEFDQIRFGGKEARFIAVLEHLERRPGVELVQSRKTNANEQIIVPGDPPTGVTQVTEVTRLQTIVPPQLPGVATFFVVGAGRFKIEPGLQMKWWTIPLRSAPQ
jgi:hypothetical protein